MPTATFNHLPDEKREKIITAIKDEFSRVPFDEVSINQIVRAAEIPRGSFYQYFADKNDMLAFILNDYREQMITHIKDNLIASDGDLFSLFSTILDFTIEFSTQEKTNSFCQNLFADVKVNSKFYISMTKHGPEKQTTDLLKSLIRKDLLDLREEDDFDNLFDILFAISMEATAEVFINIPDYDNVISKYRRKLALLKRIFTKDKESDQHA